MNYYNEFDPGAAAWLRELIAEGLIPKGHVDDRSITDVHPADLDGYTQCHFFAGIGGWSYALQLAGWSADRPVWTGSCPCQAFSVAGKQRGVEDERDLWPAFFRLIRDCRPQYVFGEQVENAVRHGWLDRVYRGMEGEGYACGAAVLGAHSVGAPHRRQRLYWGCVEKGFSVPSLQQHKRDLCDRSGSSQAIGAPAELTGRGGCYCMAEESDGRRRGGRDNGNPSRNDGEVQAPGLCSNRGMADNYDERREEQCVRITVEEDVPRETSGVGAELRGVSGASWQRYQLIYCRDGAVRRVPLESVLLGVADGVPEGVDGRRVESISEADGFPLTRQKEGRPMLLKGYGNAIVPQVAAEFIKAFEGVV